MTRVITADYIYPGNSKPIKNGLVAFSEEGKIVHIGESGSYPSEKLEKLAGIICPAFINTHCHLELSHLKGKVQQKTGLHGFIQNLQTVREAAESSVVDAMELAETEMLQNGIVAVGDISNSTLSFELKKRSRIHFHTFVELFGFNESKTETIFQKGIKVLEELKGKKLSGNLSPHSPYSVSNKLMEKIAMHSKNAPISIHNQETEEENKMFLHKKGKMLEMLESFQNDISNWQHTKSTSLKAFLLGLPKERKLLLVHNTFTSKEDIEWAENIHDQLYWCFCPKANLYIEDCLPQINKFHQAGVKCTLGTDSLASNNTLSILEEMKTIQLNFPDIPFENLLGWACINAAEFLGLDHALGSIEKGKTPGLLHLRNIENGVLEKAQLSRII